MLMLLMAKMNESQSKASFEKANVGYKKEELLTIIITTVKF